MNSNLSRRSESGQAIVIIALVMIVLLGFAALAIDGSNAYIHRRIAQNAADAGAFGGIYYLSTENPTENDLWAKINDQAEDNGLPDTNATLADTINANVEAYLTTSSGSQICKIGDAGDAGGVAACNGIPANAVGVETLTTYEFRTAFAQLVGFPTLVASARAVAILELGTGTASGSAIFAGSTTCQNAIDISGSTSAIVGGIHSNNDITISGQTNNATGSVSYVSAIDPASAGNKIVYDDPTSGATQTTTQSVPVIFNMEDYQSGGAKAVEALANGEYYNAGNTKIDAGWLTSNGYLVGGKLKDGIYYTTDDIDISTSSLTGDAVSFVSRKQITFSGSSHTLRPYQFDDGTYGPLAFTDYEGPNKCNTFVIKMSGSSSNWWGVMYAPNGLVEMSGSDNSAAHGAIIANTVKLNGSNIFIEYDPDYFPPTPDIYFLVK